MGVVMGRIRVMRALITGSSTGICAISTQICAISTQICAISTHLSRALTAAVARQARIAGTPCRQCVAVERRLAAPLPLMVLLPVQAPLLDGRREKSSFGGRAQ